VQGAHGNAAQKDRRSWVRVSGSKSGGLLTGGVGKKPLKSHKAAEGTEAPQFKAEA